jgi:hypothetical protein
LRCAQDADQRPDALDPVGALRRSLYAAARSEKPRTPGPSDETPPTPALRVERPPAPKPSARDTEHAGRRVGDAFDAGTGRAFAAHPRLAAFLVAAEHTATEPGEAEHAGDVDRIADHADVRAGGESCRPAAPSGCRFAPHGLLAAAAVDPHGLRIGADADDARAAAVEGLAEDTRRPFGLDADEAGGPRRRRHRRIDAEDEISHQHPGPTPGTAGC